MDVAAIEPGRDFRRDIPVVPVLVHGARMPRAEQLPDELEEFAFRHAVELTHARWDSDVQVLVRALSPCVQAPAQPPSADVPAPSATPVATRRGFVPAIAALAAAGIGLAWWQFGGQAAQSPAAEGASLPKATDAAPPAPVTAGRSAPGTASAVDGVNVSAANRPPNPVPTARQACGQH